MKLKSDRLDFNRNIVQIEIVMAKKVKASKSPDLSRTFTPSLLGDVIKAKRTQSNITQTDAALLSGISKQTYINIEQGSADVKVASLMKVVSALGVKISIEPWQSDSAANSPLEDENDVWV
ncbi:MAG: helix-turn-helix domain-containing protein [Pseudoalteromonas sp.]|uniref:helix-turn-helix domain-containing protein n=1 Tax=Pseudoalteromonas sp. TaxID=53249 RepID=UPI0025F88A1C|nr:helix-turn-helix transcriptional regulator [Pseudoalteromonas sp.]MCH2087993.1 helix-turn-helix domain-containing protein [Pseudoalteromonas sp.]